MRGSDADAAIYYLAVMIAGGEDPKFIARRMIVFASEDVGNADPQALQVAVAAPARSSSWGCPSAASTCRRRSPTWPGRPSRTPATRPIERAWPDVRERGNLRPPKPLRDASYAGAAKLGHGQGYQYPHDYPGGWVEQQYLPDELLGTVYYEPSEGER